MASLKELEKELKSVNKELKQLQKNAMISETAMFKMAELKNRKAILQTQITNAKMSTGGLGSLDEVNKSLGVDVEQQKSLEITIHTEQAKEKIEDIKEELSETIEIPVEIEDKHIDVEVNTETAISKIDEIKQETDKIETDPIDIEVNTETAISKIDEIEDEPIDVEINTDIKEVEQKIDEIEAEPIDIKVNTEEIEQKIDKIEAEPIDVEVITEKSVPKTDETDFQKTEQALKKPLHDTMMYVLGLSRMLNSINRAAYNGGSSTNSVNIEDYFNSNNESILPYGVTVKSEKINTNEDNGEDEYELDFGVDNNKLTELGEDYKEAVLEFVDFLNKFKEMTKILGKSALNNADPNRMVSNTTGEVFEKFKDYIKVSNVAPDGLENVDYIKRNGQYISQKQFPESEEAYRGDIDSGIDGLGLFTKTISERLLGYEENGEKHAGYQESMEKLNTVALKLFDSFGKLAAFIPALSQTPEAFSTFLFSASDTSLIGQDLFRRLTYSKNYDDLDYEGPITKPSDIALQDTLGLKDFKINITDVLRKLEDIGIETPKYDNNSSVRDKNITGLLVNEADEETIKLLNTVDSDTFKQDNFEELSEEEKKAATVISDFRANLATTANTIKSIAKESSNTTNNIPEEGQIEFGTSYKGSKSRSGAVLAFNDARSEVESMDKELAELDVRMNNIEKLFSSGDIVGLTSKNEFDGNDPLTGLSKDIITLMNTVNKFSQGPYSKSAQQANGLGEKMFDPAKYINKLNEYANKLIDMSQSDKFNIMTSSEGLKDIDTAIKNVERIKNEQKQSDVKDKLGNALITSSLKQFALEKELIARESASNSGLLSGVELDKNNAKINEIKNNLESLRKTIAEANSEAEKSGIPLEAEAKLVDNLKNSYNEVATALGSTAQADTIFNKLSSAKTVSEIDAIVESIENLKHLVGNTEFAKGIINANGFTGLIKSGNYERELSSKLINTNGLRGDELNIAKFNNMAYEQLIRNTQKAQTGYENPFGIRLNNINADELKDGIQKVTDKLKSASNKIDELESTGVVNSELISYKDKMRQMQYQLDNITNGLNESSGIGELRNAFEKAKNLGITIDGFNDKLARLDIDARFKQVKTYVSDQNATRLASGQSAMTRQEEADYYASQLPNFEEDTREYIEILKLKNQAEQRAADEAQKAAEEEKKAHEDAVKAAKEGVTNTLQYIKRLADGINNAVNKIVSIIRQGISLINRILSTAGKVIVTLGNGVKSIITLFGNLGNRLRGNTDNSKKLSGSFNILKGTATELRSKIMLLKGAFDQLFNNQMVKKAENLMASVYSLRNIVGGNATQEVLDWANSMEYAFGISAKELIGDINELTGVLYGLGMTGKDTAIASENILMMSRYLAFMGAAGGDTNQVMSKLVSGMKGMTASVDDLGVSVRDAQMNSFLESLKVQGGEFANIATDFSSLNEEARVYVRYASLIEQFTKHYDITNFAKALDTVTGRMQIMKQTANSLVATIGTGLAKAISKLAIFIVPLLKAIESAITRIFAFFGIDVSLNIDMNEGSIDDVNEGLEDTKDKLDEVDKAANKAKGSLQGFDRVNNVTTSSGSGNSGSDGFDYKKLMASMLGDLNKLAEEASQSFADKMQERMNEAFKTAWDKFNEYAKKTTGRVNFDLGFDWTEIKENLKRTMNNIKEFIKSWGKFFITLGLKIADDVNIGSIITKITELLAKLTDVANTISQVLQPALDNFYEVGIRPIMEYLGIETLNILDIFIDKLNELANWFTDNEDTVFNFFDELGNKVSNELPNKIKSVVEEVKKLVSVLTGAPSISAIVEMDSQSTWGNILTIISSLRDILGQLLDKLIKITGNDILPWLQDKLNDLASFIKENKDNIVELIDKIANIAVEGFKAFVDILGKLIGFVVENPNAIYGFFAGLLGLKVASWFTSTAASMGLALIGIEGFITTLVELFNGTTLTSLGTVLANLGTTLGGLGTTLSGLLGPIAIVIAAVVGLVAIITDLWNTSDSFRDTVVNVFNNIKDAVGNAFDKIKTAFEGLKEALSDLYSTYESSGLKDIIELIATILVNNLGSAIIITIDLLGTLLSTIINLVSDLITVISGLLNFVSGIVKIIVGLFVGLFTGDWELVKEGAQSALTGLIEVFGGLLNGFLSIFDGLFNILVDLGKNLLDGLWQGISEESLNLFANMRQSVLNFIDMIKELFGVHSPSTVFADIGINIVQGLINGISNMWTTLTTTVLNLCNGLVNNIKNKLSEGWNTITNWSSNLGNTISDKWSNLTNRTKATSARSITAHAAGGSINAGNLFIANENGAELVGNITGASGAQVANNSMIIEAMKAAVFEATYNANAEVANQTRGKAGAIGNTTIKIDGFGLIDESTLSQLARLISPYLQSNNKNIANVNFTI